MARPPVLDDASVTAWLSAHPGWSREGDVLVKTYRFDDFAGALAFAVRVGMFAEKCDHHPELEIGWGKAVVKLSTHEPAGLTQLDLTSAEAADKAHHA
jgi:4a-hydroxytetrahydrobiopterin dehydratase